MFGKVLQHLFLIKYRFAIRPNDMVSTWDVHDPDDDGQIINCMRIINRARNVKIFIASPWSNLRTTICIIDENKNT